MKHIFEFVGDISSRDMIFAVTIRSPVAKGKITGIECPKLDKSYRLITAADIPGKNSLADFPLAVLAESEVSYIGQPVAILAGPDEAKLEELCGEIKVRVDEETPFYFCPGMNPQDNCPNEILVRRNIFQGELDSVLQQGDKVLSETYVTGIQEHWYPEPHGAAAVPGSGSKNAGTLAIYTATQWPFHVKRSVSGLLGPEIKSLTINPTHIPMHLDGKIWYPSLVSCHAALAAWITGKTVMLIQSREEDFMFSPKRSRSEIKIQSTLGARGEIRSSTIQVTLDMGAEGIFKDEIIGHACLGVLGVYNHLAYNLEAFGVRSNIPPQGPMAGFGLSQGFFAIERHVSRIADNLGQDPAVWRKNNFLSKKSLPLTQLIDAAAASSDYYRKWASYELLRRKRRREQWKFSGESLRGIGISIAFQGNGFLNTDEFGNANCSVEVTLEKNGSLEIKSSIISSTSDETWKKLAFDILGVEGNLIRFTGNTDTHDCGPATLSRYISSATELAEKCFTLLRKQRLRDPLPITVKCSAKTSREAFARPACAAVVVEAEIETVSWMPHIRGIWLALDGGKIISESRARRSLRTACIQALGWASKEQLYYEEGRIKTELYRGYDIPSPAELPPIKITFIDSDSSHPKGIGDLPFSCVPAAFVQAISQAIDHPFERIPLDERDIWNVCEKKLRETSP